MFQLHRLAAFWNNLIGQNPLLSDTKRTQRNANLHDIPSNTQGSLPQSLLNRLVTSLPSGLSFWCGVGPTLFQMTVKESFQATMETSQPAINSRAQLLSNESWVVSGGFSQNKPLGWEKSAKSFWFFFVVVSVEQMSMIYRHRDSISLVQFPNGFHRVRLICSNHSPKVDVDEAGINPVTRPHSATMVKMKTTFFSPPSYFLSSSQSVANVRRFRGLHKTGKRWRKSGTLVWAGTPRLARQNDEWGLLYLFPLNLAGDPVVRAPGRWVFFDETDRQIGARGGKDSRKMVSKKDHVLSPTIRTGKKQSVRLRFRDYFFPSYSF